MTLTFFDRSHKKSITITSSNGDADVDDDENNGDNRFLLMMMMIDDQGNFYTNLDAEWFKGHSDFVHVVQTVDHHNTWGFVQELGISLLGDEVELVFQQVISVSVLREARIFIFEIVHQCANIGGMHISRSGSTCMRNRRGLLNTKDISYNHSY